MYPKWLYHKDLAPDGRLIRGPEQDPIEDGWVDTPAAFDPAYVAPPPRDPDAVPDAAVKAGYVHRPYPSHRYNASGESRIVHSLAEDDMLDPADWKDSPAAFGDPPPAAAPAPAPPPPASEDSIATQRASLYAAKVADIVTGVETMTDLVKLETLKAFEQSNPKGARVGVIKALEARVKTLTPPDGPEA
jgi:hypothetical protein